MLRFQDWGIPMYQRPAIRKESLRTHTRSLPRWLIRSISVCLCYVFVAKAPLRLILLPLAGLCCFCLWHGLVVTAALDFIFRPRRLLSLALCWVLVAAFL